MKISLRFLRYNILLDRIIGFDSDNPTTLKEIGKSHMVKAAILTKLGDYNKAFYKYYQAYQCFVCCISYHSDSVLGQRRRLHKEVELFLICLVSIGKLYFFKSMIHEGLETLNFAFFVSGLVLKPKEELYTYITNCLLFYDELVARVYQSMGM